MEYDYDVASGVAAGAAGLYTVLVLAVAVLMIIANWKIFEKAGVEGWKSLVPFLNLYVMFKITFGNGWLFLLMCIPCVNFVILIIYNWKLTKAFGQSTGFFVLTLFFPNIAWLILAFGKAQYIGVQ